MEQYSSRIHDLAALLGMDSSMTITRIHPSLNELCGGIAKNMSDNILAKLEETVISLEEEKQKRIEKVRVVYLLFQTAMSYLLFPPRIYPFVKN